MVKVDGNIHGNQCRLELVCNTDEMVSNQYHLYHKTLLKILNKRILPCILIKDCHNSRKCVNGKHSI